jgi:hypothetical protein
MQALTVASRLDWSGWFAGVAGAFISGGAGAIGAGVGATLTDPGHDLVGVKLYELMGIAFVTSGIISMAKFLQTHPVPDPKPPQPAA